MRLEPGEAVLVENVDVQPEFPQLFRFRDGLRERLLAAEDLDPAGLAQLPQDFRRPHERLVLDEAALDQGALRHADFLEAFRRALLVIAVEPGRHARQCARVIMRLGR